MLNDTQTLKVNDATPVNFVRRSSSGTQATFVPQGDTPLNERKLRVSHEATKSGTVNSLFAVSHLLSDSANPTAAPRAAAVQIKFVRPPYVTAEQMTVIAKQAISGLFNDLTMNGYGDALTNVQALLNQEV